MSQVGKIRFGLVGGGEGAFIGPIHRMAAELDGQAELVCGAFSADPERARRSGVEQYQLPADRCYASYQAMLAGEQERPADKRMQFVIIATPNHLHFPMAQAALASGFAVVCDKPLCLSVQQAEELRDLQQRQHVPFAVTYNYSGYPMVRAARQLVAVGTLGSIRRVQCSYLQGWLAQAQPDNKQAQWRTDPQTAGGAGCFGDIGSHAEQLLSFVTGLSITRLCADLNTFVPDRALDDDGTVMLQFAGGAKGVLTASQIAVGCENDLSLAVYGERGSLEWRQAEANSLLVHELDQPLRVHRAGGPGSTAAVAPTRLPAGHPEGYIEALATLYQEFISELQGLGPGDYPGLEDGVRGMQFIEKVVESSTRGAQWVDVA
ncbi:MAG: Gfo/Idh/MocA family oxidoreductase [Pseudomonadota bacterium]